MSDQHAIYLHIPFCSTKCTYCAFNTYTQLDYLIPAFVEALSAELSMVAAGGGRLDIHTIYFGGGTPSLLTARQIEFILQSIDDKFRISQDAEITVEANPNDLSLEYLQGLFALGVNRLSIGMQSALRNELALFRRRHDQTTTIQAMTAARKTGFYNISLDLIYGVPHQTLTSWKTSLQALLSLHPQHVSLYALGLEEGTPMKHWVTNGVLPTPNDDLATDMYELATEMLGRESYRQYEISNWAKPRHESRHNLQYWRNLPYLGLGPGAHGFAARTRYASLRSPAQYIQVIRDASTHLEFPRTPATEYAETLDYDTEIAETLLMGLRLTQEGIQRRVFRERFGMDVWDWCGGRLQKFIDHGLLTLDEETLCITERGRMLSNMIFRELV